MEGAEPPDEAKERKGGEILGENSEHFKFSALEAAACSPAHFAGAAGHDFGRELIDRAHGKPGEGSNTAIHQLLHERGPEIHCKREDRALGQAHGGKKSLTGTSETEASKLAGIPEDGYQHEGSVAPGKSPRKSRSSFSSSRWLLTLGRSSGPQGKEAPCPKAAQHYDVRDDVILQLEALTPQHTRLLFVFMWTSLLLSLGLLLWSVIVKRQKERDRAERNFRVDSYTRAVGALVCLTLVSLAVVVHCKRFLAARRRHKIWKRRRLVFSVTTFVELCAQWVCLLTMVIPNFMAARQACLVSESRTNFYAACWILRWTAYNTIFLIASVQAHNTNVMKPHDLAKSTAVGGLVKTHRDVWAINLYNDMDMIADKPLVYHAPKLLLWIFLEACILSAYGILRKDDGHWPAVAFLSGSDQCSGPHNLRCTMPTRVMVMVSLALVTVLTYFVWYCYYLFKMVRDLRRLPYENHKVNNLLVRLQLRTRMPAFAFFIVGATMIWYMQPRSCWVQSFEGMLSINVALTAAVLAMCFLALPVDITRSALMLNVWLQEYAWMEADVGPSLKNRNEKVPKGQGMCLESEPMFCVETCMMALYWSLLVYDVEEVESSQLSVEEGSQMFQPPLEHSELIWERGSDTKVLLAWNRRYLVLAFRGTASLSNVFADLKAWQAAHIPCRGNFWRRPKVHAGFQRNYHMHGFAEGMLKRISDIMTVGGIDIQNVQILVTGHSLGGALATLAAYDIAHMDMACQGLMVYTFGSPRTGNHAFAEEFQRSVPHCFHVINDQDVVAMRSKFGPLYKLGGHRVVITMKGDLIVRPTAAEASVRVVPCSGSVAQHLLTAYMRSMLMVLLAQFCSKSVDGGGVCALRLFDRSQPWKRWLLQKTGLSVTDLMALQDMSTRKKSLDGGDGSMPSSSSRKVVRFLRSGLNASSQMECDAGPGSMSHISGNCFSCLGSGEACDPFSGFLWPRKTADELPQLPEDLKMVEQV